MFGLSTIQMVIAGVAALFVITLAAGIVHTYNDGVKAKAELVQCKTANDTLNAQIVKQNAAVESLQKASQEAALRAKAALVKARQGVIANQGERERLAGLQSQAKANPATVCPAGDAVSKIRQGLK